jgi:transcriptional regulator with XRE-family HTH domain
MASTLTFRGAEQIRALREGLGYTQQELAERVGVSKQALSQWENGETEPSIGNLLKLVNLTGAKLDSFFVES